MDTGTWEEWEVKGIQYIKWAIRRTSHHALYAMRSFYVQRLLAESN